LRIKEQETRLTLHEHDDDDDGDDDDDDDDEVFLIETCIAQMQVQFLVQYPVILAVHKTLNK
jgi:hypothetical protein